MLCMPLKNCIVRFLQCIQKLKFRYRGQHYCCGVSLKLSENYCYLSTNTILTSNMKTVTVTFPREE